MQHLLLAGVALSSCEFDADSYKSMNGAAWFQNFWEPCNNCCNQTRLGRRGDGGKWVCVDNLDHPAVLSVGSNNEFSFELDVLRHFSPKAINVYDHTSLPHQNPKIVFHKKEMTLNRFTFAIRKGVDIVKVDCEGCEKDIFTPETLRILHRQRAQILVEFHWHVLTQTNVVELWQRFIEAGYGPFHKEPNIEYTDGSCIEYSFKPYH